LSWLTVIWSLCAGACGMLGFLHFALWLRDRTRSIYLISSLMACAALANSLGELLLMQADEVMAAARLMRLENLAAGVLVVTVAWFIDRYFGPARRWLAVSITALWSAALIINFASPWSLVYSEITALEQRSTLWGEPFVLLVGHRNPWVILPEIASLLLIGYSIDASIRAWRRGMGGRAVLTGGAVAVFIIAAGIHAPLVDAGLVPTPYMVGLAFMAIVLMLGYQLAADAFLTARYAARVKESEERWRALTSQVQLAVIGLDEQGRVNFTNPFFEKLLGSGAHRVHGRPATDMLVPSEREEALRRLRGAARAPVRPHGRWTIVGASGEERTIALSHVRLTRPDGAYAGILSVGADITGELAARQEVARLRSETGHLMRINAMGEVASALAHELNQPLAAILSNAQAARRLMAAGKAEEAELREILDDIVRDDKRAGEIIHGLRAMLRKGETTIEVFDLREVIGTIARILNSEIIGRRTTLRLEEGPGRPMVRAGRVEIQQVVLNLALNALEAMEETPPASREMVISCAVEDGMVTTGVRDSGPGISPTAMETLFEPFQTTKAQGLGVGLSICRRIVESSGGRIQARNNDGGGATLSFSLPALDETQEPSDA